MNNKRAYALLKRLDDYADYLEREAIYVKKELKEIKAEMKK